MVSPMRRLSNPASSCASAWAACVWLSLRSMYPFGMLHFAEFFLRMRQTCTTPSSKRRTGITATCLGSVRRFRMGRSIVWAPSTTYVLNGATTARCRETTLRASTAHSGLQRNDELVPWLSQCLPNAIITRGAERRRVHTVVRPHDEHRGVIGDPTSDGRNRAPVDDVLTAVN